MSSTFELLFRLASHLSSRRKLQIALVVLSTVISAVSELFSLGTVLPFLYVLSEPDKVWKLDSVQPFLVFFQISSPKHLLFFAAALFSGTAVVTAFLRLANLWIGGRFAAAIGSDLSCEAYRLSLYQPYETHLRRNTSEIIHAVTTQISRSVVAINALILSFTALLVSFAIFIGLLLVNWIVAVSALILFGSSYFALAMYSKKEVARNSIEIATAASRSLKALREGFGAIRDIILDGTQDRYLQIFRDSDTPQRYFQARNEFLGGFPRFAVEALGLLAIAFLSCAIVFAQGSNSSVIPLVGVFALGAQRLLPAMQQAYSGWASVKGFSADLASVLSLLDQNVAPPLSSCPGTSLTGPIEFRGVSFRYLESTPFILEDISISIPLGQRVGVIGGTGSGKTTLTDLMMGLLRPSKGYILVDGIDINKDGYNFMAAWRSLVSHVPQNIYLADGSIVDNIAFGIPAEEVDHDRLRLAASQAQIAKFIESTPDGYSTFVGERGIRLSGGQRQRLGIARALYKQSKVLIMDEATSALDDNTEQGVMDAIDQLDRSLTVVMIAHRLSTVAKCDRVIRLDHGRIVADGSPGEVLEKLDF